MTEKRNTYFCFMNKVHLLPRKRGEAVWTLVHLLLPKVEPLLIAQQFHTTCMWWWGRKMNHQNNPHNQVISCENSWLAGYGLVTHKESKVSDTIQYKRLLTLKYPCIMDDQFDGELNSYWSEVRPRLEGCLFTRWNASNESFWDSGDMVFKNDTFGGF